MHAPIVDTGVETFSDALFTHLRALTERDIETFAATLDDDVVNVGPGGERTAGRAAVTESHRAWFASESRWTFEYELVYERSNEAFGLALIDVTYRERDDAAPNRFLLSLAFERRAERGWRLIYDQNTPAE